MNDSTPMTADAAKYKCDECGDYSENVALIDGGSICEICYGLNQIHPAESLLPTDQSPKRDEEKTAKEILFEHGIDTMSLNDDFNSQLFAAMERYAEQFKTNSK